MFDTINRDVREDVEACLNQIIEKDMLIRFCIITQAHMKMSGIEKPNCRVPRV